MTLNDNTWAELCFVKDGRQNGWGDSSQETEIYFIWHGGARVDEHREVCFFYGHNEESWYHSYQSINSSWPMDTAKITPKTQFNYLFDYNRFYQSENNAQTEFALILEHLFVNSDGFAVLLDQYAPWFIRRHSNDDNPVMCFSADSHYPYAVDNHDASYRDIKIRLFSSTNIRTVLDYVVHKSGHIPNATKVPHEKMFKYPIWRTLSLVVQQTDNREEQVATFVNELTKHNLSMQSELLFDDYWAQSRGEFSFNTEHYTQPDAMLASLRRKGLGVGLMVFPNISGNVEFTGQYYIKSNGSLTNAIDFSIPDACDWYETVLKRLHFESAVDSFLLSSEGLYNFTLNDTQFQNYPSLLTTKFVETGARIGNRIVSELAFKTQHLPVFVQLTSFALTPDTELLRQLIRNVLSVSIGGHSFVSPFPVGFNRPNGTSAELYLRWVQAIALMPGMSLSLAPWSYSEQVLEITRKFIDLHAQHSSTFIELAKKRLQDGSPIIRPLWYVSPEDRKTFKIDDQFMLGSDILVAPIVEPTKRERVVYLPAGVWFDQHGTRFDGNGEFNVTVPLEELAYFRRRN